jgi:hypothetical protein
MAPMDELPAESELAHTRGALHLVAAHVLGRRRHEVSGRFGLRASPGGFATPAFGEGPEALRIADGVLVRDTGAETATLAVAGSTMRQLITFAGADPGRAFSAGAGTPALGDLDEPLAIDRPAAAFLADWYTLGARALDRVLGGLGGTADPATVQLWPEHFDLGTNVVTPSGGRVDLGASPGDDGIEEPYLYVGPQGADRPGDPAFWNAPFGAVLRASDLSGVPDAVGAGVAFLRIGLDKLAGTPTS